MNFLNLCLQLPNLGLIVYYVLFVIIIPFILISYQQRGTLKYYWPILVGLANVLTITGKPHIFNNLYVLQPENLASLVSTNIINMIAIMGIIWQCINIFNKHESNNKAILAGIVMFFCAFILSRDGIKVVMDRGDQIVEDQQMNKGYKLIVGFCTLMFIIIIEAIFINLIEKFDIVTVGIN